MFFTFLAILKCVGLPPAPMINVGKSGLNFLFTHSHNIELGVRGAIYAVVSIIFAPDCRQWRKSSAMGPRLK
jgi:hypothetical protein